MKTETGPSNFTVADRQLLDAIERATCSIVDEDGMRCGQQRVDAEVCEMHRARARALAEHAAGCMREASKLGARVRSRLERVLEQRERQQRTADEIAQTLQWSAQDRELLKLSDIELAKHANWMDR